MKIRSLVNTLAVVGLLAVMAVVAANGFVTDGERWTAIGLVLVFVATVDDWY